MFNYHLHQKLRVCTLSASFFYFSAYELAKQQRKNFGEDITSAVRYAKKKVKIVLINIYPEKLVYVATAELKSAKSSYLHTCSFYIIICHTKPLGLN